MTSPATASDPSPPTLASLAEEISALRTLVHQLKARIDGISAPLEVSLASPTSLAAVTATPDQAEVTRQSPEQDPVRAMRAVLQAAMTLALAPIPIDPDEADAQFADFAALIHTERRGTPLLEQSLRNYTWQQLRRNVLIYLDDDHRPDSFETVRMTPAVVTATTQQAKFFVRAKTRMPTPITFRRDLAEHGAWRIEASSL